MQVLDTLKSCRRLCTVWCRLETVQEEPQHMLVSWIHPRLCNNLVLSSWPCSSNPLIILVAFPCVQIHRTPILHCGHGFGNWFKRLDPCRRGECESYSCVWYCLCFVEGKARGYLLFVAITEDASSIFCLSWSLSCSISANREECYLL